MIELKMQEEIAVSSAWLYNYGSVEITGEHSITQIEKHANDMIIHYLRKDISIPDQIKKYKRQLNQYHEIMYGNRDICIGTPLKEDLYSDECIDYAIFVAALVKLKGITIDDHNGYTYILKTEKLYIMKVI
jgi:hypothetical protein